jgi:hypothetical protein
VNRRCALGAAVQHAFGHAVVQQRRRWPRAAAGSSAALPPSRPPFSLHPVFDRALDAAHGQAAVVRDVGGLGGPGRDGAQAGRDDEGLAARFAVEGLAIGQQCGQALALGAGGAVGPRPPGGRSGPRAPSTLSWTACRRGKQLLDAEVAEGTAALELGDVQGHW